jgi:uncharacterized membrane protein
VFWRKRHFSRDQEAELVDAIRRAEQGNRGEVRVHVEATCKTEPLKRAEELFGSMCMDETSGDTGVLLYVATKSRKAAVWAGRGIHGAAADGVWQAAADAIAEGFRAGNELPNKVTTS